MQFRAYKASQTLQRANNQEQHCFSFQQVWKTMLLPIRLVSNGLHNLELKPH